MTSTSTIVPATTPATAAVTTPATAPPTSSPPPTTPPPTTTTTPATTTPPTTAACPVFTDTDVKADGFPGKLSGLVGADVRTGIQPCSERFVLELQGTGDFPGWWVRYQAAPLTDDPRGEPVQVAGAAFIVVTVESWMTNMEGDGYHGPTRITPTNVSHIKELVMLGNFESVTTWAIGLDSQRPFRVTTLDAPPRLVIDISVA
ncbi:MAG: AMIN-like domain-containing (lipo)protein [Ilumatobacteraceae bacterium]